MPKGKYKCPKCKKFTLIILYDDCAHCGGGQYYECMKCNRMFDTETKEEL